MAKQRDRGRDVPDPAPLSENEAREETRRAGPLESLFQEAVRRAAGLGLSGLFLTEEALRRAFAETAPKDLVQFVSQQGEDLREQVIERATREFGDWLRSIDVQDLLRDFMAQYELKLDVRVSATPKEDAKNPSLSVVTRHK